jgi:hypothetical protein
LALSYPDQGVVTVLHVALGAYRSCSWREKREVLAVFWRGRVSASATINAAAFEYGRIAPAFVLAIGLELVPIAVVSVSRGYVLGELAIGAEAIVIAALARSLHSYRLLKSAQPS